MVIAFTQIEVTDWSVFRVCPFLIAGNFIQEFRNHLNNIVNEDI